MLRKRYRSIITAAVLVASTGVTPSVFANCSDIFYVVFIESFIEGAVGQFIPSVFFRRVTADPSGTADLYGTAMIPPTTTTNGSNIANALWQSFVDNTKVRIFTDDTDCTISTNGESLGSIYQVRPADAF